MKKIITKTRVKILLVVLATFLVVKGSSDTVFMAGTPKVNPEFIASLKNAPQELVSVPGKIIAFINKIPGQKQPSGDIAAVQMITPPPNTVFKTISKGVSAAENPLTGQTMIQVQAGTKYRINGTVTINGKEYPNIEFVE